MQCSTHLLLHNVVLMPDAYIAFVLRIDCRKYPSATCTNIYRWKSSTFEQKSARKLRTLQRRRGLSEAFHSVHVSNTCNTARLSR
eukprot:4154914-Amphidinium_carterae.1